MAITPIPIEPLADDAVSVAADPAQQNWGIFLNGEPVVDADCVVSFEYRQDWKISDYPVEQGGFESYNKVATPYDVRVRYANGGSEQNRQALLTTAETIGASLDLYSVVTPEKTYRSANVTHYDYRRTSNNGVGLIQVEFWLEEVRVTAVTTFSNTKTPAGSGNVKGGNVSPTEATADQQAKTVTVQ